MIPRRRLEALRNLLAEFPAIAGTDASVRGAGSARRRFRSGARLTAAAPEPNILGSSESPDAGWSSLVSSSGS